MTVSTLRAPKYRLHKGTGQALVQLNGQRFYLGKYGTPESEAEYRRVVAEWLATGKLPKNESDQQSAPEALRITELAIAYFDHVQAYYRRPDGSPTSEVNNVRQALRPLRAIYGSTPAAEFGPLALQAVRQRMIDDGWCRTSINRAVARIRQLFKWAVANESIPASVFHGLQSVPGLRLGRSGAKESEPVKPVARAAVDAILPKVTPPVAAMIRLQLLTGCRPGEIVTIRGRDLETSGKIWLYRPERHKGQWRGHERVIYLGPQAQEIIKPWLQTDLAAPIFSPQDGREQHLAERRKNRRTPMTPSQANRKRTRKPRRAPREAYTVQSYAKAIVRGCEVAFNMPAELKRAKRKDDPALLEHARQWRHAHCWHPHQLRHSRATELRKQHGLEVARIILGHKSAAITEIYAEADQERAVEVMGKIG